MLALDTIIPLLYLACLLNTKHALPHANFVQEFLPDNPEDESPFGSLDASELDEVFEDTSVSRIEIDALKVALR